MKYFVLLLFFFAVSCRKEYPEPFYPKHYSRERSDTLTAIQNRYAPLGRHNSIVSLCRPRIKAYFASKDTLNGALAELLVAQAFLMGGQPDSAKYYADNYPGHDRANNPILASLYHNIMGGYHLSTRSDYSMALRHYLEAARLCRSISDVYNEIVVLSNIVYIYFMRGDIHGMEYASKAMERLSETPSDSARQKAYAHLAMAQMLLLNDNISEANRYIKDVDQIVSRDTLQSLSVITNIVHGQISKRLGDTTAAQKYFWTAIEKSTGNTYPGTVQLAYLEWGRILTAKHDTQGALAAYRHGLNLSERSRNRDFRQQLLLSTADMYFLNGNRSKALEYYREYARYSKSVNDIRQQEFNDMVLERTKSEHERATVVQRLTLERTEHRLAISATISVACIVLSIMIWTLYRRKNRMHRTLAEQYNRYRRLLDSKDGTIRSSAAHADKERESEKILFSRIDELIRKECFYRRKDVSLTSVAEILQVNRTYVSKAINTLAGTSFWRYIDSLRIAEAARIISHSPGTIRFKELADELGYASVSVFSKAFKRETGLSPSDYRRMGTRSSADNVDNS